MPARLLSTFDDILAPFAAEEFFAGFHGRRVLHVAGRPEKFASLMTWEILNALLEMRVWTSTSMKLVLDKRTLPAEAYCRPVVDRNNQQILQPDPERVIGWGRKGATLVLHETESLVPGMARACEALEQALGSNASINLYCSWRDHQGFDSHFDKHDVFAFHIAGEKRWRIYENRFENPIEHAAFQAIPQAWFDANKGKVQQEILLRPGDLLYLPRGTYHDALAASEACLHLSCAVAEPIGLNWLTAIWELAVEDPFFRASLPRLDGADGAAAFERHIDALAARFAELLRTPLAMERARALRRPRAPAPRFGLPSSDPASTLYRVRPNGLAVVRRGAQWMLKHGSGLRPIGESDARLLSWILSREEFSRETFDAAFREHPAEQREALLTALVQEGRLFRA